MSVKVRAGEIDLPAVKIRSLTEAEQLVAGLQQAARRAFGARTKALGVPSMTPSELGNALDQVEAEPGGDEAALVVSMPGTIEVYHENELQGFINVGEGGRYAPL